jgi:predicted MarR family transcription regulator
MNRPYIILKIALGIHMYPNYRAFYLSEMIGEPIKSIYTYYTEAEMVSQSWLPNLITPEQLKVLSGSDLTVLYYLYTADPDTKILTHCFNVNMAERTFKKALRNLRRENLIEQGVKGRINSYTISKIPTEVAHSLN